MTEFKAKITPLKFKGQKPVTQPKTRLYSELVADDTEGKQTNSSPNQKEAQEKDAPKLNGSPSKKVKVESASGSTTVVLKSDKTAAELSFDLVKKKRIMERIDDKMKLSHR